MKTTSNGRIPQNIKGGISHNPGMDCEIRGKPRGNLECGSAQPSLYSPFTAFSITYLPTYLLTLLICRGAFAPRNVISNSEQPDS
jgi:hypothetical protein